MKRVGALKDAISAFMENKKGKDPWPGKIPGKAGTQSWRTTIRRLAQSAALRFVETQCLQTAELRSAPAGVSGRIPPRHPPCYTRASWVEGFRAETRHTTSCARNVLALYPPSVGIQEKAENSAFPPDVRLPTLNYARATGRASTHLEGTGELLRYPPSRTSHCNTNGSRFRR